MNIEYIIIYLLGNCFGGYIIYRFMRIFFDINVESSKKETIYYILYVVLSSCFYLFVNIPIIMMIYNLLALFIVSSIYQVSLRKRIIAVVNIYIILMVIESIIALGSGYFNFPLLEKNNYSSIMGVVLIKVFSYIAVLLISNYRNIKNGINIPKIISGALILIPTGSLFIIITLFQANSLNLYQVLFCCIILFIINLITFYFYDFLNKFFEVKLNGIIAEQQTEYYMRQLNITGKSLDDNNAMRHDWYKHIGSIYTLVQENDKNSLIDYLDTIKDALANSDVISNTGNVIIDSILNFELSDAKNQDIEMTLELDNLPNQLNISEFDITTIFSNLLSNAIIGCKSIPDKRNLDIIIRYSKGTMLVFIKNTFNGHVLMKKGKLISTKKQEKGHGIGLSNVNKSLIKYNGEISIEHDSNYFSVELILYL